MALIATHGPGFAGRETLLIAGLAHAKERFAEPKLQFGLGFENVTQENAYDIAFQRGY